MKKIITLMIVTSILISCGLDNKETIKEKAINITKKEINNNTGTTNTESEAELETEKKKTIDITKKEINNNTGTTNTESEAELETEVNDLLDEFIDSLDNYEK